MKKNLSLKLTQVFLNKTCKLVVPAPAALELGHPTTPADLWGTFRSEGAISSNLANLDMGVSEAFHQSWAIPLLPPGLFLLLLPC